MSRAVDETTYLLPPEAYYNEDWFHREQAELFERAWMYVALESDIAEPGDFVTDTVGRAPIVVVRGSDGEVRAFHNICRHRGLPVLEGAGSCGRSIVCPYHRWNYGIDGALRSVPHRQQFGQLDFDGLGLHRITCDSWKGMIFVRIDPAGDSLTEWLGTLGDAFPRFHPETLVEGFRVEHHVAANWKLYVENHVDWLHLWYLHSDTLSMYDHAGGEREEHGRHWTSYEALHDPDRRSPDEAALLPGLLPEDRRNGAHFVFPSLAIITNEDHWMVWKLRPTSATTSTLDLRILVMAGTEDAVSGEQLEQIMYQDYAASEAIQRAVRSPAFAVGPMATSYEREITRFQRHCLEFVPVDHAPVEAS